MGDVLRRVYYGKPKSTIRFEIIVHAPRVVIIGQHIQISLILLYSQADSLGPIIPAFKIRAISAKLIAYTPTRVPTDELMPKRSPERHDIHLGGVFKPDAFSVNTPMEIKDQFFVKAEDVVPSFKSYRVCRTYELDFSITVECEDKLSRTVFKIPDVTVLPELVRSAPPVYGFAEMSSTSAPHIGFSELSNIGERLELPAYEDSLHSEYAELPANGERQIPEPVPFHRRLFHSRGT
jgi:hypothetical protein